MSAIQKIFVVGGTGAQGMPVVRGLVDKYRCRILTRDVSSPRALELKALGPNIELFQGVFTDTAVLRQGMKDCDGVFFNLDGFNTGEKAETFWAIRSYELAREQGVRFFVYGNLDYGYKKGGYDPKYRCGHYDGKGRIGEWVLTQSKGSPMGAAVFTTGPYMDMTVAYGTPMMPSIVDGTATWAAPLGKGAVPHVCLEDCGPYVRWLFEHFDGEANGMDLEVAIDHIAYEDLASAFTAVTGRPARYVDVTLDEYWEKGPMSKAATNATGYTVDPEDAAAMTMRDNFTGFWNLWKNSGGNAGVIRRDYALLDRIHPTRIKSAHEWFKKQDEEARKKGSSLWQMAEKTKPILKIHEDFAAGKITHRSRV